MAKELTDKQLIEVLTTDGLTIEQLQRRSVLIQMQAAEVGRDKIAKENEAYVAARGHAHRMWKARCADILAQQEKEKKEQSRCFHFSGGSGYQSFFSGDNAAGYGRCVARQKLPTGEVYALCFRCQKEWHSPRWVQKYWPESGIEELMSCTVAVIKGLMPLSEYVQMEREWKEALGWKAKTFESPDGSLPESVKFYIPALVQRMDREAAEFKKYLEALPPAKLMDAGIAPTEVHKMIPVSAAVGMTA